jgi:hypothetical protein
MDIYCRKLAYQKHYMPQILPIHAAYYKSLDEYIRNAPNENLLLDSIVLHTPEKRTYDLDELDDTDTIADGILHYSTREGLHVTVNQFAIKHIPTFTGNLITAACKISLALSAAAAGATLGGMLLGWMAFEAIKNDAHQSLTTRQRAITTTL